jgi:hypothetical protein
LLLVLLLAGLSGCSKEVRIDGSRGGRTVLVYMIASDLGYWFDSNIKDMMFAATAKNLNGGNLVVFYSSNKSSAELFEICEGAGGKVTRQHVRDYTDASAISPATMRQVIRDVVDMYPSASYGMILSSHGTAWLPGTDLTLRAFGEEGGRRMELSELAEGLPDGLFDFLVFDACSMAAVECVYELRNKAGRIMASPSETIRYGIPYRTVLPCLFTREASLEEAARNFYLFYRDEYSEAPFGNMTVVRTGELENLALITREIIAGYGRSTVFSPPLPDWQLLSHWAGSPTGLYDFADVMSHIASVDQYVRLSLCLNSVVTASFTTDETYCSEGSRTVRIDRFSGLSVYPLQSNLPLLNDRYMQLQWYRDVYLQ